LTVSEGVYPNGLPHPPDELRVKIAIELGIIVVLAALFVSLAPQELKSSPVYFGLSLVMLGYIGFTADHTRERIWGPPDSPDFDRIRRCFINMSLLTVPPMILFLILGMLGRHYEWAWFKEPGAASMFGLHFFVSVILYLPWALLQQTLFQFFLLGRLRALLPWASPWTLSLINGLFYGLVHLPDPAVTGATIVGGVLWSYSYHRDRFVLPIAISHAVLGATFYYWVYGRDLLGEFIQRYVTQMPS
jgi:hypothetical protein